MNADTLEFITVHPGEPTGEWADEERDPLDDELARIQREWQHIIDMEPPPSYVSFSFMERFIDTVTDPEIKSVLQKALGNRKPFRHFNAVIHQSVLKEDWFAFRQKCLESFVFEALSGRLPSPGAEG